jgi:hypothetical protein
MLLLLFSTPVSMYLRLGHPFPVEVGITLRSSLADAMVESVAVVVMNLVRPRRFARSRFLSLCTGLNEKPLRGFRASARGRAQAPR